MSSLSPRHAFFKLAAPDNGLSIQLDAFQPTDFPQFFLPCSSMPFGRRRGHILATKRQHKQMFWLLSSQM